MTERFLAVGAGSFIARQWAKSDPAVQLAARSDYDALIAASAAVVNFAIDPAFKQQPYAENLDQDLQVARKAAAADRHFVMLSTRKVYRLDLDRPLDEDAPLDPSDHYGRNKLESESRIRRLLGDRLTVLRLSNVYDYEFGRRSFFGLAMTRLKEEGRIVLDISPFVSRDFIYRPVVTDLLSRVCRQKPAGTFSLGSGIALPLGRIAQWLIQGYGSGVLECVALEDRDNFVMDSSRLHSVLGMNPPAFDFERHIKELGSRLQNE